MAFRTEGEDPLVTEGPCYSRVMIDLWLHCAVNPAHGKTLITLNHRNFNGPKGSIRSIHDTRAHGVGTAM